MSVYLNVFKLLNEIEESIVERLSKTPARELSARSAHILVSLYQKDGQNAAELAASVGCVATSFTPVLDRLQNAGLLLRRPDPTDRRGVLIYLTANGEALKPHITEALADIETWFPEAAWKVNADEPAELAAAV